MDVVAWTNKVGGLFPDLIGSGQYENKWKGIRGWHKEGRIHSLMQGTVSSLLAVVSIASLASMAFLSPTANMANRGRGAAVADKRALQLQVFTKIIYGQSVADAGASHYPGCSVTNCTSSFFHLLHSWIMRKAGDFTEEQWE